MAMCRVTSAAGASSTFLDAPRSPLGCVRASMQVQLPLLIEVARSVTPCRKFERETVLKQPGWNHSTALQDGLGCGAREDRADLQHPLAGWKPQRYSRGFAEEAHEVIRQRIRSRYVDDALDSLMVDQPANGAD